MNQEIKARIEQIKCGEVPQGYKKTKVGIVPSEWENKKIECCIVIQSGLVNPQHEPYLSMMHIGPDNIEKDSGKITGTITAKELGLISGKFIFDANSIVYSKVRPNLNKICIPDFNGICSADCYSIKTKSNVIKHYMFQYMLSGMYYKQAVACSMRTGMPKINQDELATIICVYPTLPEQQKIADILTTQDKVIELKEKLITEKQQQKKWLMQNLLTGKKKLKGFRGEWKKVKLSKCIKEVSDKTNENNQFDVLSVTKNGIVKQSEHFNKQIASENNIGYKILRKNNLVFSTMNLWMGSLDVLKQYEIGIVSPAYKTFEFTAQSLNVNFGNYFMKSNYMIWIYNNNSEQGASVVRRNLDLNGLLNTLVPLPPLTEQTAIAEILSTADREIELLQKDLAEEKQKKKALMQLLLTGIVRV